MKKTLTFLTLFSLLSAQNVSAAPIDFTDLNPAKNKFPINQGGDTIISQLFSRGLPVIIVLSGTILLIMIIMGGFTMLSNPTEPQAQEVGKNQITFALIGFFLMFMAYWIIQILELMFGLSIV